MHFVHFSFKSGLLAILLSSIAACGGGGGSQGEASSGSDVTTASVTLPAPAPHAQTGDGNADGANPVPSPAQDLSTEATSLVPLAPVPSYTVSPDELLLNGDFSNQLYFWGLADPLTTSIPSQVRPGGKALLVNTWAGQKLSATALTAGRAYTLTVSARKATSLGLASISVAFYDKDNVLYRNYQRVVTSTSLNTYTVNFTAPAYVAVAQVSFGVSGGAQVVVESASLKMRGPIVQTEPIADLYGSYVPAGYGLAFNDEFKGTTLNRDKWLTRYIYDGATKDRMADEKQRYRDNNNHMVSADGILSLVARVVSSNDPDGIDYESGMIRSDWTTRYGYIEARVRMPGAVGVFPAFWLTSDVSETTGKTAWPPEIDIFEFVNNGVEDKPNMLHTGVVQVGSVMPPFLYTDPAFATQWTYWAAPFNFNDGWHTIAAEWTPTSVSTYVDGVKITTRGYEWKDASGLLAGPAHILLNLAVGGSWAGRHGIDAAAFPQALQINWVRAYKKL